MNTSQPGKLPRRRMIAAGLGAVALTVPATRPAAARFVLARGMLGGGLAQFGEPDDPMFANFAMLGSALQMPDGKNLFIGQLRWAEAGTGLVLTGDEIGQCSPIEGTDGAEVRGKVTRDGETYYPFVAQIFDSGEPGAGEDRIILQVNTPDAQQFYPDDPVLDDFVYDVEATLIAGDLQWVIRDIDLDTL